VSQSRPIRVTTGAVCRPPISSSAEPARKNVADADQALVEAERRQVLAEPARHEERSVSRQLVMPRGVMLGGVEIHRLVGAAMHSQVSLGVPGEA